MKVDVTIIGAGPAGLFAAIQCAKTNSKILLLEKNQTPGKKLLITGAGQCNLTQSGEVKSLLNHYGKKNRFLRSSLYGFSNKELINFFTERGIQFYTTEEGKIFPTSDKAGDILNILVNECKNKGIEINCTEPVQYTKLSEQGNSFEVGTNQHKYETKFLILTTGGQSYPTTGSTGDGYRFAKQLGHSIEKPQPALTPVYIKDYHFSDISGISLSSIELSLWRNNSLLERWSGDILFTHRGLSGPGILNHSRYMQEKDLIKLRLINAENEAEIENLLIDKIQKNGKSLFKNLIKESPVPHRLLIKIMDITGIPENKKAAQINKNERNKFAKLLYALPLEISRPGGFNEAMVTRGGINLQEINRKTMESRIISNLFAAGEILDIDGDTGGYNLQAAFSTAYMAGQTIKNRLD